MSEKKYHMALKDSSYALLQNAWNTLFSKFNFQIHSFRIKSSDDFESCGIATVTWIIDKLLKQAGRPMRWRSGSPFFRRRRNYDTEGRWVADSGKAQ